MLALLTLNKLIKLEFVSLIALNSISEDSSDSFYDDCHDALWQCESSKYSPLHSLSTFDIDRLAVSLARSNRFIKSSFALSLLWVAKYFSSLADSYKHDGSTDLAPSHDKIMIAYAAYRNAVYGLIGMYGSIKTTAIAQFIKPKSGYHFGKRILARG